MANFSQWGGRASSPQGLRHETSPQTTARALARALAGGRVHFLLASVLQHAIDYRIEARKLAGLI